MYRNRCANGASIHLLNATLPLRIGQQIGRLYLTRDYQELPVLDIASGHRSHDICQPWSGCHQRKGTLVVAYALVEMLGANASCHFMHDRNTFKAVTETIEQVHDAAPCNEKAVCIAQLYKPFPKQI